MLVHLVLRAALACVATTLLLASPASATSNWSVNATTATATWTENTASAGIPTTLKVVTGANAANPADDRMESIYPITGAGCMALTNPTRWSCPLGNGTTVAFDTFVASLTGALSTYTITADFDRPGVRMQSSLALSGGPNASNGTFNGSGTTVGSIATSGFGTAVGGADDDALTGNDGPNTLTGGLGDDALTGLKGNDTLDGGPGDDAISPGAGTVEKADGGEGSQDTLSAAGEDGPSVLSLDGAVNDSIVPGQTLTATGFENLSGSNGNDTLTGDAGFNHIYGGPGNDKVDGNGGGHDVLRGNSGDDQLFARDALTLFSDVACEGGTDVAVVDAADLVAPDCETIDRSPAPPSFVPPTFPGGPTAENGAPAGNSAPAPGSPAAVAAAGGPVLTLDVPKSVKRSSLTRGVTIKVASDQPAGVTVELVRTAKAVRAAAVPKDNLVIARSTKPAVTTQRTFTLKPERGLIRGLNKLSVRITASNASGVVTVVNQTLKLK